MNTETRLKQIIDCNNLNLKEFSDKYEIPYRTLQNYLLGKRKIGVEIIIKLHTRLSINIHWLLTGEGEMYCEKTIETVENMETSKETIEWLNQWWENADEKHRHWLEVQMKHYFPDYAAWLEEEKKKNNS